MLTRFVDGKAAFQLSSVCPILHKGFLGEYKLRKIRTFGPERFTEEAVKNEFSHPHDALQYAALIADHAEQVARSYQHMGSRYAPPPSYNRPSIQGWV